MTNDDPSTPPEDAEGLFGTEDMSVGGAMGWLTSQRHKQVSTKEKPIITINLMNAYSETLTTKYVSL